MSRILGNLQRNLPVVVARRFRIGLCAAAFVATGLAVYGLGRKAEENEAWFVARAMVRLPLAAADRIATGSGKRCVPPFPDSAVREEITSEANLARATARAKSAGGSLLDRPGGADPGMSLGKIAEILQVTGEEDSPSGKYRVSIACADRDAGFSVRLVNALAEQYADDCRDRLQRELRQAAEEARRAREGANKEIAKLKGEIDALLEVSLKGQEGGVRTAPFARAAGRSGDVPDSRPPTGASELAAPPAMVDNPDWIERSRELEQLQRQRRDLLEERTPLHPEVQGLDLQIARARQELAAVRQEVPGKVASPPRYPAAKASEQLHMGVQPPPGDRSAAIGPPDRREYAQLVEMFHSQNGRLQAAAEKAERLAVQERQATEAALRLPRIEVRLAVGPEVPQGPNRSSRWLLAALVAGLAAAAGVGMISHGTAIDPPLCSLADVRASLTIPVVAAVEADASGLRAEGPGGWAGVRWQWIILGAMVIAVSLVVVLRVGGWL